jgi:hypothetical protein
MSGGHFDYDQYKIGYIADSIESQIERNGRRKTKEELREQSWIDKEWLERNPEDINYYEYPPEVIEKFKEAVNILRRAQIYAHRIDWLLSGDDGEESFLRRLKEDLSKVKDL